MPKHITTDDIFATVSYLINLAYGVGVTDDIDHLGNRRIRAVGELLQNQFRIGFTRMERVIRERMTLQAQDDEEAITPQALINIRPVVAAIREFFGSSPLSQFMDQNNPLAELTHKEDFQLLVRAVFPVIVQALKFEMYIIPITEECVRLKHLKVRTSVLYLILPATAVLMNMALLKHLIVRLIRKQAL